MTRRVHDAGAPLWEQAQQRDQGQRHEQPGEHRQRHLRRRPADDVARLEREVGDTEHGDGHDRQGHGHHRGQRQRGQRGDEEREDEGPARCGIEPVRMGYLTGLGLTLAVEVPVVVAVGLLLGTRPLRTGVVAAVASLLTHPPLWFVVAPALDAWLGPAGILVAYT